MDRKRTPKAKGAPDRARVSVKMGAWTRPGRHNIWRVRMKKHRLLGRSAESEISEAKSATELLGPVRASDPAAPTPLLNTRGNTPRATDVSLSPKLVQTPPVALPTACAGFPADSGAHARASSAPAQAHGRMTGLEAAHERPTRDRRQRHEHPPPDQTEVSGGLPRRIPIKRTNAAMDSTARIGPPALSWERLGSRLSWASS